MMGAQTLGNLSVKVRLKMRFLANFCAVLCVLCLGRHLNWSQKLIKRCVDRRLTGSIIQIDQKNLLIFGRDLIVFVYPACHS